MQDTPARVLVLGLDGLDFSVIGPLLQSGEMPHLAGLCARGAWGKLCSTLPPISSAAWTSLCTGTNPGKHGVFGFARTMPGTYDVSIVRTTDVAVPQLWELVAGSGKRSLVFALPQLHPPVPVNGVMVTGVMTPHARSPWCYPRELEQELTRAGLPFRRRVTVSAAHRLGYRLTLASVNSYLRRQVATAQYLMARDPWDLAVCVLDTPDLVQHIFMGKAYIQARRRRGQLLDTPAGRAMTAHFRVLDEAVGAVLAAVPDDTTVLVVSDHGFGPKPKIVHLDRWLVEQGYLRLRPLGRSGPSATHWRKRSVGQLLTALRVGPLVSLLPAEWREKEIHVPRIGRLVNARVPLWSETRAVADTTIFSMGLRLNVKGREPEGIVEPGADYEALRDELIRGLLDIRDPENGQQVVLGAWRREEVHSGSQVAYEPDILLDFHPDYRAIPRNARVTVRPSWGWQAAGHTNEGIVVAVGPGIAPIGEMATRSILDIAPSVLALLGVGIPQSLDGSILPCVTVSGRVDKHEAGPTSSAIPAEAYSAEDEELVKARLADLGYL